MSEIKSPSDWLDEAMASYDRLEKSFDETRNRVNETIAAMNALTDRVRRINTMLKAKGELEEKSSVGNAPIIQFDGQVYRPSDELWGQRYKWHKIKLKSEQGKGGATND